MKTLSLVTAAFLLSVSADGFAKATVEVEWKNPTEYRDVKPTSQSRSAFREQTFKKLEEYLSELAEALPDGQTLSMTVTNLDLAGEVWPASFVGLGHSASDVRLIKRLYIPRMEFSYSLKGADGEVVQSKDVKLKDMSFQDRHNPFFTSETLRYEKNMLKEWFADEFPDLIAKNH